MADRVRRAEAQNRDVRASVASLASLRAAVLEIENAAEREAWHKRVNVVMRLMEHRLVDVDRYVAEEYAMPKSTPLPDENGEDVGEAERFMVATAIREGYVLLTQFPQRYEGARQPGRLLVETIPAS